MPKGKDIPKNPEEKQRKRRSREAKFEDTSHQIDNSPRRDIRIIPGLELLKKESKIPKVV